MARAGSARSSRTTQGAHVALTYRERREEGQALRTEPEAAGRKAVLVRLDQADPDSRVAAVETAVGAPGRLDILVDSAAINQPVSTADLDALTPDIRDRLLDTHLRGSSLQAPAAAEHLMWRDRDRIVDFSGFAGLAPVGSSIAPAVSKAGLIPPRTASPSPWRPPSRRTAPHRASWKARASRPGWAPPWSRH